MKKVNTEYSEMSWNPVTGCTKISAGCRNCYAESMAVRLNHMGQQKYRNGWEVTLHPDVLSKPYMIKKQKRIFVDSMGDLFHKDIPVSYIQDVFRTMRENPHHVFLILTKRADILAEYDKKGYLEWQDNIWMGVTVEDNSTIGRADYLRQTGAKLKFISCEPLLSDLSELNLQNINWMIVGAESGPSARPMREEWVLNIKDSCIKHGIPFFFKKWKDPSKKGLDGIIDGKVWNELPQMVKVKSEI